MGVADLRREYNLAGLRRKDLAPDPLAQFKIWFDEVTGARSSGRALKFFVKCYKAAVGLKNIERSDLNAMTLATVDKQGHPSARTVLLKGITERGFVFYTNYNSRKGHELSGNSNAALVFYWPDLERQVCVTGTVTKVTPAESDAYFQSRPRGSRIGAWASNQSESVAERGELEKRWQEFERRYPGAEVPRPPHWGGYELAPVRVEFWQGRPNRLHDRFCYTLEADKTWRLDRLSP